jgi:hypothetical protein
MRTWGRGRWWMGLLVGPVVGGCYHYTPIQLEEVRPTQEVRARVSLEQAERLEEILPPGRDPRILEGRVVGLQSQALLLDVAVASAVQGVRVESFRQRVDLPLSQLLEVERKELDRWRTGLLLAGAAVVLGSILFVTVIDPGGDRSPTDPGAPENRIPLPRPLTFPP